MMPQRVFPIEDDVTREIAKHRIPPPSVADRDQHIAAMKETYEQMYSIVRALQEEGMELDMNTSANMAEEQIDEVERNAIRMILAAQSVGIRSLCPHTEEIRPLAVFCDPPFVICVDCASELPDWIDEFWIDMCDCCGARTKELLGYKVTVANLVISGEVCDGCSSRTQ